MTDLSAEVEGNPPVRQLVVFQPLRYELLKLDENCLTDRVERRLEIISKIDIAE